MDNRPLNQRLSRVDLNLLVALQVLLQECNVSRAAERLCITPSAMSKTLGRLRELFDDELFIRTPGGLAPSARARDLSAVVDGFLAEADRLIFPSPFDPAAAVGNVSLGMSEPASALIMAPLIRQMRAKAPGLALVSHNVLDGYLGELEQGRLDFCVYPEKNCGNLEARLVGGVELVAMMRAEHPLAQSTAWDAASFLEAPKVIYSSPDVGQHWVTVYSDELRRLNKRNVPHVETSQLFTAVNLLLSSDYMMVTARGLSGCDICGGRLVERELPAIPPFDQSKLDLYLIFHRRNGTSPLMCWLADEIASVVGEVMPKHR